MKPKNRKHYKNQKFPIGVTVFSFFVMLAFFIYSSGNASSSLEYTRLQNSLKDRSRALELFRSGTLQSDNEKSSDDVKESVFEPKFNTEQ